MDNFSIDNFIYVKDNALPKEDCEAIIKDGLVYINAGSDEVFTGAQQFPNSKLGRDDFQLRVPRVLAEWFRPVQKCIFEAFDEYAHYISSCKLSPVIAPSFKWQMTQVGGGFSVWHIEQSAGQPANRMLTWSIYLNDVTDGGETEFLYQKKKVAAKAGTLVIWPAGVTHPHRGNPPYSNDKFIITGWFEFPLDDVYNELLMKHAPRDLNE